MSVQQQALDMLVRSIDPTSLIREYLCTRKKSVSQAIELLPQEIQLLGFMDKLHAIVHLGDLVVIYAAALLGKYEAAHAAQVLRKFIAMIELLEDRIRYLARICKIENECRILLCYCLAQENQFEEALRLAGDVKINSLTCEFAYFKAYCYFEKRQFKEAAQVIKDYVKNVDESLTSEAPVTADMFDLYANCLSHIGDNSSAQISFSNAISMASDESSQILHSFNKALHDISIGSLQISKRLLEMISRSFESHNSSARASTPSSIELISKYVRVSTQLPTVNIYPKLQSWMVDFALGLVHSRLDDFEQSVKYFSKVPILALKSIDPLSEVVFAYLSLPDYAKALELITYGLQVDSSSVLLRVYQGNALFNSRAYRDCISVCTKALDMCSDDASVKVDLLNLKALALNALGEYTESIRVSAQACAVPGLDVLPSVYNRVLVLWNCGEYARAASEWLGARQYPRDESVSYYDTRLGQLQQQQSGREDRYHALDVQCMRYWRDALRVDTVEDGWEPIR